MQITWWPFRAIFWEATCEWSPEWSQRASPPANPQQVKGVPDKEAVSVGCLVEACQCAQGTAWRLEGLSTRQLSDSLGGHSWFVHCTWALASQPWWGPGGEHWCYAAGLQHGVCLYCLYLIATLQALKVGDPLVFSLVSPGSIPVLGRCPDLG